MLPLPLLKIKVKKNLQFWNLKHQVRLYLDQISGHGSFVGYRCLAFFVIICFLLYMLLLTQLPLSPFQRLLLYDSCLFCGLPAYLDVIFIPFCFDNFYFHLQMYRPANRAVQFIREMLFGGQLNLINRFFAQPYIQKAATSRMTLTIARHYLQQFLYTIWYFVIFETALLVFYLIGAITRIVEDSEFFFGSANGYLSLAAILYSAFVVDCFTLFFGTIHMVFAIIYVAFTILAFLQFSQVNAILSGRRMHSTEVFRFTRLHTQMLSLVFAFNRFYGGIQFVFMTCQLPVNSYLLTRLLLGQFNHQAALVFLNFITMQFLVLIIFHVLAAMYCTRIHACKRRLFHWSAQSKKRCPLALTAVLRLDGYVAKFNVNKKYGITYSTFGLISFKSFTKFVILYSEILLYFYKMVQYQTN